MQLMPKKAPSQTPRQRLLKAWEKLPESEQQTLLAFADFLVQRQPPKKAAATVPVRPEAIPRPEQETVVGAIKRLSATYPMLDKSTVLNESSALMSAHIMQGRSAADVIDELEALFRDRFQAMRNGTAEPASLSD